MKSLTFCFVLLISSFGYAQQPNNQALPLAISARSYNDRVVLRIIPASAIFFNQGNRSGYIVEKAAYVKGLANEKLAFKALKGAPFKRWPNEQWESALSIERAKDTLSAKFIGLGMAFSDESSQTNGDVLKDGLKSLKEQQSRADMKFGYAMIAANKHALAAEGLALRINDSEVKPGQTYVYRVRINQQIADPKTDVYLKVTCTNFNSNYLRNDKSVKLKELDKSVSFSFPEGDDYYAFNVERSDDDGNTYKKITNTSELNVRPTGYDGTMDFTYADTGLINYKKYRYRITVATYYADELLLAEFTAMPRDKTPPPAPFLKTAIHIKPHQVELKWETKSSGATDLKGFAIRRAAKEDGTFSPISKTLLPIGTTSYIDETFDPDGSNYYIVEAIDTAGNASRSFPAYVVLTDSIPPANPIITSAKIDSLGKITIKVKPNTEKDFMGYQLQKANAKDHDFSVVTETFKDSLGRTTFILKDSTTLNTLTKKIYYKVIAFDTHFNQSQPSNIIELKKRDTIPPVSPLIKDFLVNDTTVVLFFANSSSEDAVRNYVLRKEVGKAKFDTVFVNTNTSVTKFIDFKIVGGKQYEYAMLAKDDGGMASKISRSIQLKTILNNRLPTPELMGIYSAINKKVELSFKVDDKLKNRKLTIELYHRSNQQSAWLMYKSIPYQKDQHLLENVSKDQTAAYYIIRLVDENKNSSNYSNELAIKL